MSCNEPFIVSGKPVVLYKRINPVSEYYLYFIAHSEFKSVDEYGDFIDKFSIQFCQLSPPYYCSQFSSPYNGYAIVVKRFRGEYTLKFSNADEKGLDVIINPRGIGIGSIIINHLMLWAKEKYPNLRAPRLHLSSVDEQDIENKARRDSLYYKIGLLNHNGVLMGDLTPKIEARGFNVYSVQDFLKTILMCKTEVSEYLRERMCYTTRDIANSTSYFNKNQEGVGE